MPRYTQALEAAITQQIASLRQQIDTIDNAPTAAPSAPDGVRRGSGTAGIPKPSEAAEEIIAALDQRISRLERVRDWIDEDHELATLIDTTIGNQVKKEMRRQRRFNVVLNVSLLILGWLLSLLSTPDTLFTLIQQFVQR